jgi:REP element-mobilizing transposase RayT
MERRFFDPFAAIRHTRNHLPHWQQPGATYFITFRLADAVPAGLRTEWTNEREAWLKWHPDPWSAEVEREYHERFSTRVDAWLDAGHGECVLRDDRCRGVVEATLRFREGDDYLHHAWVVMPNHVHALVSLNGEAALETVLGAWKSVSSRRIGKLLGRHGTLWQEDYFDRLIRDAEHFGNVVRYIRRNPVKAKLRDGFTLYESEEAKRL